MPKDQLRTLVYNTDVNTLLQDGLDKVAAGYTTFEEILKLIELEDDDIATESDLRSAIDAARIALNQQEESEQDKLKEHQEAKEVERNISAPAKMDNSQIINAIE